MTAEQQIEIDDMPLADTVRITLREQHDSNSAFIPPHEPDDCGEYECGANNKSAVTEINSELMEYINFMLTFVLKVLHFDHIKLSKTIIHKTEGRNMHGFTRLIATGHGITDSQKTLINSLQHRFMKAIYPNGYTVELAELFQQMNLPEQMVKDIEAELDKRAFKFLMKNGERNLSAPIRVRQLDGEVILNQSFMRLPYRPEQHFSEQVTVIAKGIKRDPETVDLALKTAGAYLEGKHNVIARYRLGDQMNTLIDALRSQETFVVTLHTVIYPDGTNSGWVVDSIDCYPQTQLSPRQHDD